jgi:parallel beta-helix repeat protein
MHPYHFVWVLEGNGMININNKISKTIRNWTYIFIILMITLLLIPYENGTQAQQTIISTDTTWTLTESPYVITGNVLIEHGVSLIIESGVIVKFDGFYYIQIEGNLIAEGTENNIITFTSNKKSPAPRDWNTLKFMSNAQNGSSFKYCKFEYGNDAITLEDTDPYAAPNITHCIFNHNSESGIEYFIWSPNISTINPYNEISNNTFTNNGDYSIRTHFYVHSENANLLIKDNIIKYNDGSGITFNAYEGNLTVENNIIINNDGVGIWCNGDNVYIKNNLIANNKGHGISIVGSAFNNMTIEHNTVINNHDANDEDGGGINFEQHEGSTNIILRYNNIYDNSPFDVRNGREIDRDISYNWWGTIESDIIEEQIHDYNDDFRRGKFEYEPFLTELNSDAPDPSAYLIDPTEPNENDSTESSFLIFIILIIIVIIIIGIVIYKIKNK